MDEDRFYTPAASPNYGAALTTLEQAIAQGTQMEDALANICLSLRLDDHEASQLRRLYFQNAI